MPAKGGKKKKEWEGGGSGSFVGRVWGQKGGVPGYQEKRHEMKKRGENQESRWDTSGRKPCRRSKADAHPGKLKNKQKKGLLTAGCQLIQRTGVMVSRLGEKSTAMTLRRIEGGEDELPIRSSVHSG